MRSFDVFDTLLARRCIGPLALYGLVEQRSGMAGLAQARSQAGHRLWSDSDAHTTQDIYAAALLALGKPTGDAAALAHLEFEAELAEVIPVRLHLQGLDPSHWLISDMHHPAWQIRRLLSRAAERVGLYPSNPLILSNRGKHDGAVWRALGEASQSVLHVGDNLLSDVEQARAHGHRAIQTNWALLNPPEQLTLRSGAGAIARAARSARLVTVGESPQSSAIAALQTAMCSVVFPVLALAALWLWRWAQWHKASHVVFVGRDGATWERVFSTLAPSMRTELLHASRESLRNASEGMVAHFRQSVGDRGVLADLCGSGASWALFKDRAGVSLPPLAHLLGYPTQSADREPLDLEVLVEARALLPGSFHTLEALCEGVQPRSTDIQMLSLGSASWATPVFGRDRDLDSSALAQPMQACLSAALEELRWEMARASDEVQVAAIPDLVRQLLLELQSVSALVEPMGQFSIRNRMTA